MKLMKQLPTMNKIKLTIFLLFFTALGAFSQTAMYTPGIDPVVENIIRSYIPWKTVEFNGKLKVDKLPVSPTLKMFMVRDSLIQVSVRVPLVGEVARVNMTKDEVLIVNKLNKTYCLEKPEKAFEAYPGLIRDIQSVFLARVVLFGSGELGYDNGTVVDVQEDREGGWMLIPESAEIPGLKYGYLIGSNSRTKALEALYPGIGEIEILYSYGNGGMSMQIEGKSQGKEFDAAFEFSSVKWGGTEMAPVKLVGYNRLGIKEFIKSFSH